MENRTTPELTHTREAYGELSAPVAANITEACGDITRAVRNSKGIDIDRLQAYNITWIILQANWSEHYGAFIRPCGH